MDTSEFVDALSSYLPDGERPDGRESMAIAMAGETSQRVVEAYLDSPGDLAAMLSGCVGATSNRNAFLLMRRLVEGDGDDDEHVALVEQCSSLGRPLLVPDPSHPVARLVVDLEKTPDGCRLIVSVAMLLAWMRSQSEYKPFTWKE